MAIDTVGQQREVVGELAPPGDSGGLHNVFRQRYLLRLLVRKELRARYQGSILGFLWSYVQPLVRFLAYFLVLGFVLGLTRGMENFAIHIFTGLVLVHYFNETFSSGTRSIMKNKGLVNKMSLPREMFPVSAMLVSGYHTLPQMVILLVAVVLTGWSPTPLDFVAGLMGFTIIAVFGMALALMFSAANVFFRDFQNVVATFSIFVMWSVPMIYPYDRIERLAAEYPWVETVYLANPVANGVILFQELFWVPTVGPDAEFPAVMPDHLFSRGLVVLAVVVLLLGFAQWMFTRLEGKFAERL